MGLGRFSGCESHTLSVAFQSRVIPMWWAELWWPEPCSARTSGSNTHTLVTPSRGVGVAAAAIPVTRCRMCAECSIPQIRLCSCRQFTAHVFYLCSKYTTLPLLAQQCGIPTALRAPCLLRRLVASQLLASRALVASQLVRFADSVLRTSWESY